MAQLIQTYGVDTIYVLVILFVVVIPLGVTGWMCFRRDIP